MLRLAFRPVDWLLSSPDKNNRFLLENYAPVQEEVCQECEIVGGPLPDALDGQFARNGPNPRFDPKAGYHPFDGDGMVHSVRIKAGKATYSNRYVRTTKLAAEEDAGEALDLKMGDLMSWGALPRMMLHALKVKLGIVPDLAAAGETTANTSLMFHAGRLHALSEGGLPYALRVMCDGVVETIGQATFEGQMKSSFTAHPKKHPTTGKLHAFGYQFINKSKPYVTYYVLDKSGKLERQFPIVGIERPLMMHDFAITENYAIFMDFPLLFKPDVMLRGKLPIVYDKTLYSRMGVLRLDATDSSEMRWFDMPEAFFAFHVLNAWEEKADVGVGVGADGETTPAPGLSSVIKIYTCDFKELDLDFRTMSSGLDIDGLPFLHVTTLNLDTGEATRSSVLPASPRSSSTSAEFPQVPQSLVGRKTRFGYCSSVGDDGEFSSVVKFDLQAATAETALHGRINYEDGFAGGECVFVPAKQPGRGVGAGGKSVAGLPAGAAGAVTTLQKDAEEDDGYLVTFATRKGGTGNSEFRVYDAKTMDSEPVCTVKLPARVPMGFHAIFVPEAELATQQQ
ncbi:unnamed protein product [Scytosiphon promiscuus]